MNPPQKSRGKIKALLAIVIAASFSYVFYAVSTIKPAPSAKNYFYEAYDGCKKSILAKLKSPSSADFPAKTQHVRTPDNIYEITSYVDAQNLFGAMVRSYYTCTVQIIDDGARWRLISLTLE